MLRKPAPGRRTCMARYGTTHVCLNARRTWFVPGASQPRNRVKAPVLGLYGAEDTGIMPDQVEAMKERLKAAGKTAEFKIYPGAGHGFFADYRQSFRADAAQDAWMAMQAWFKKYKVLD
jgi:dienelactone hydrolase